MLVNISAEYPDIDTAEYVIRQIKDRAGDDIKDIRVNQNKSSGKNNDAFLITTGIINQNFFTDFVSVSGNDRHKPEPYSNKSVRINVQCQCTALDSVRTSIVSSGGINIRADSF